MKNEEGDATVAALREANFRIDKLSARVQPFCEVDGRITSRSSSPETDVKNLELEMAKWIMVVQGGTPA